MLSFLAGGQCETRCALICLANRCPQRCRRALHNKMKSAEGQFWLISCYTVNQPGKQGDSSPTDSAITRLVYRALLQKGIYLMLPNHSSNWILE